MKKGTLVLLELEGGHCVLGRVHMESEDHGELTLVEAGDTDSDQLELLARNKKRHVFRLYPPEKKVIINLWRVTRTLEWTGRLPKGWKTALAALEEAKCDCEEEEEEEDEDEDEDEDT